MKTEQDVRDFVEYATMARDTGIALRMKETISAAITIEFGKWVLGEPSTFDDLFAKLKAAHQAIDKRKRARNQ